MVGAVIGLKKGWVSINKETHSKHLYSYLSVFWAIYVRVFFFLAHAHQTHKLNSLDKWIISILYFQ
jgi:hypothetical protein